MTSDVTHADAYIEAFGYDRYEAGDYPWEHIVEGFLITADRFLNREEAYQLAQQYLPVNDPEYPYLETLEWERLEWERLEFKQHA